MAVIQWVQYNERVLGENSPDFPTDVTNRPLKQLLTDSDLSITANFPGFPAEYKGIGSPEGVIIATPGQLYFQQDAPFSLWIKQQNIGSATGWAPVGVVGPGTTSYIAKFDSSGQNVNDSMMHQIGAPLAIIVGAVDPVPGATENLRTAGGFISQGVGASSTIIGESATAPGSTSIAIGFGATSTGPDSIAIGGSAITGDTYGIAIGRTSTTGTGTGQIAIGTGATTSRANSIAIGPAASVTTVGATFAIAIGYQAGLVNVGTLSVAIGSQTNAAGANAVAIGPVALAAGATAVSVGSGSSAPGTDGIAIGRAAIPVSIGAIAIGAGAVVTLGVNGIAIGTGAKLADVGPSVIDSVVIGAGSFIRSGNVATSANTGNVVIGPRNTLTSNQTAGFQPVDGFIVIGYGHLLTNTLGGTYANGIVIGSGLTASALSQAIIIGCTTTTFPAQWGGTAIGNNVRVDAGGLQTIIGSGARNVGGSDNTIIGRGAIKNGANGQENIIIGTLAQVNNVDYNVVIGSQAVITVATGAIAIGRSANIGFANCIALAPGATPSAANQCVIGSNFTGGDYRLFIFGQGPENVTAGINTTWRMSNLSTSAGANAGCGNLIIQAGLSLGNNNTTLFGEIQLVTGAPGASGSTLQTATKQFAILKSAGGAAAPNTAWYNVTSGAAAQVGTLTNAPTAGNPTFWLPVQIMGATYYLPAWS